MDILSATVLDVRTIEEFEAGNIDQAINVPLHNIEDQIEIIKSLPRPIIVCCEHGVRSQFAVAFLVKNGLKDIFDGGGWRNLQQYLHSIETNNQPHAPA